MDTYDTPFAAGEAQPGEDARKLLMQLFDHYCEEEHIGLYQRPDASPIAFIHWLEEHTDELCEESFSPQAVEYVRSIPQRYTGLTGLLSFWPYLTLGHRDSAHPVRAMSVGAIIHFEDGTIVNLMRIIRAGILSEVDISDADLISTLYLRLLKLVDIIHFEGRDKLHDAAQVNRGCIEGDVFAYLVELLNKTQHPPGMALKLQNFFCILQTIFAGVIAPQTLRAFCGLPPDAAADRELTERSRVILQGGNAEGI